MPSGSRSRRNKRKRQRRQAQNWKETGRKNDERDSAQTSENDEAENTDDAELTITTEQKSSNEEFPIAENLSLCRGRMLREKNRCKIEKKTLDTNTQICEITSLVRSEPLKAKLDHIAGVGIIESSRAPTENVSVSEPVEPCVPLPKSIIKRVENLPSNGSNTAMSIRDRVEIREVTESEADEALVGSCRKEEAIVVEAESDLERESSLEEQLSHEEEKAGTAAEASVTTSKTAVAATAAAAMTSGENDDIMSWEMEKQLRNFIETLRLPGALPPTALYSAKFPESDVNSRSCLARGQSKSYLRKRADAATAGSSLQSQVSLESCRSLDIIQEEGTLDTDNRHIRDFINEQISKSRREPRGELSGRNWVSSAMSSQQDVEQENKQKNCDTVGEDDVDCCIASRVSDVVEKNQQLICDNVVCSEPKLAVPVETSCPNKQGDECVICTSESSREIQSVDDLIYENKSERDAKINGRPSSFTENNSNDLKSSCTQRHDSVSSENESEFHYSEESEDNCRLIITDIKDEDVDDFFAAKPTRMKKRRKKKSDIDEPFVGNNLHDFFARHGLERSNSINLETITENITTSFDSDENENKDPESQQMPFERQKPCTRQVPFFETLFFENMHDPSGPGGNIVFIQEMGPADFPFYPGPPPAEYSRYHDQPLAESGGDEQEAVESLVRLLLAAVSKNDDIRHEVQNKLSLCDLEKLPASIRLAASELMEPRAVVSEKSSGDRLRNNATVDEPQRTNSALGIDEITTAEIAPIGRSSADKDGVASMSFSDYIDDPLLSPSLISSIDKRQREKNAFEFPARDSSADSASKQQQNSTIDCKSYELSPSAVGIPTKNSPDAKFGKEPRNEEMSPLTPEVVSKAADSQVEPIPAGDYLHYVHPSPTKFSPDFNSHSTVDQQQRHQQQPLPHSLRDLCIEKIMSLPAGEQIIGLMETPEHNVFRDLDVMPDSLRVKDYDFSTVSVDAVNRGKITRKHSQERFQPLPAKHENSYIHRQKNKPWTGVPTTEDPSVLLCLSPSQQASEMKTSADNLLDLHSKFVNRRKYHNDEPKPRPPASYFVDVTPIEMSQEAPEPRINSDSSRLLNIIKQNPIRPKSEPNGFAPLDILQTHQEVPINFDELQRLRAERLNTWFYNMNNSIIPHSYNVQIDNANVPLECDEHFAPQRTSTPSLESKIQPHHFKAHEPAYINSALIIKDESEVMSSKGAEVELIDNCHDVNEVLDDINDMVPKNLENPDVLKQMTTKEIMASLKELQDNMKINKKNHKRYSLPEEYFEEQLKYIENLENKLQELIIAEEENKSLEKFVKHAKMKKEKSKSKRKPYTILEVSFLNKPPTKEISKQDEAKEESEVKRDDKSIVESQVNSKRSRPDATVNSKKLEIKEECRKSIAVDNDSSEDGKLKKFLRDLHDPSLDDPPSESVKSAPSKQQSIPMPQRPYSIAVIPNGEVFRQQMYNEYVHKVMEREVRKQRRVIKITGHRSERAKLRADDLNKVEQEFIEKAKSRMHRYGIKLDDSDSEGADSVASANPGVLLDGQTIRNAKILPKHLQEFLEISAKDEQVKLENEIIAPTFKALSAKPGVWSPGSSTSKPLRQSSPERSHKSEKDDPIPSVWTPSNANPSPVTERKEFRPVQFESPVLSRKKYTQQSPKQESAPTVPSPSSSSTTNPWHEEIQKKESSTQILQHNTSSSTSSQRIVNSYSAPSQGLNSFSSTTTTTTAQTPRLPRAQNPTITLLQKAREGHIPKGAAYLDEADHSAPLKEDKPLLSPGEVKYTFKSGYDSEPDLRNSSTRRIVRKTPRKYEGIGPTTGSGIPICIRSEVKEPNQAKWYKRMYESLHRAPKKDDYVTIRYKPHRGTQTGYSGTSSGYLSEPEPTRNYDRSATLDNRRQRQRNKENDYYNSTLPRGAGGRVNGHYSPETYHLQPGRIEDYVPGNCSIQEKETKEPPSADNLSWEKRKWWDEVMDIFDGWLDENGHEIQANTTTNDNNSASNEQNNRRSIEATTLTTTAPKLQRSSSARPALQTHRLSSLQNNVSSSSGVIRSSSSSSSSSRSLLVTGSSLNNHHQKRGSIAGNDENIRRDLEQQRLRQTRLLESLYELTSRPRSGSVGDRIIRPLDEWPYQQQQQQKLQQQRRQLPQIPAHLQQQLQQQQIALQQQLSSSASSSSSVTNSSSTNGTSSAAVAPPTSSSSSASRLPFEQSNSHSPKSYMTHALKESGYESDSTLVFRRREDVSPLSPIEQRIAYKTVQKGGDVPLHGFRKLAPERPKDDTEIEYYPISSSLTRLRGSCSTSPASSTSSMSVSRIPVSSMASRQAMKNHGSPIRRNTFITVASSTIHNNNNSSAKIPSPPKRKSSRNNRTLKLYSSSSTAKTSSDTLQMSNVRLLREKLRLNLDKEKEDFRPKIIRTSSSSPVLMTRRAINDVYGNLKKRSSAPCLTKVGDSYVSRMRSRICDSVSPVSRSPKVPILRKTSEIKASMEKYPSRISLSNSSKSTNKVCNYASKTKISSSSLASPKKETKARALKRDQDESCRRLSRSKQDLTSLTESRRTIHRQKEKQKYSNKTLPTGALLSSSQRTLTFDDGKMTCDNRLDVTTLLYSPSKKLTDYKESTVSSRQKSILTGNSSNCEKKRTRSKPASMKKVESRRSSMINPAGKNLELSSKTFAKSRSRHATNKIGHPEKMRTCERVTVSEIITPTLTADLLRQHQETMSDSFFQHLFLKDVKIETTEPCPTRNSSVLDRARMFQEVPYNDHCKSEPSLKSLNIYLTHKRPVSNSRFRNWEQESISSRSSSPCNSHSRISKFESITRIDDVDYVRDRSPSPTHELPKERSLSEPPIKSLRGSPDPAARRSPSLSPVRSPSCRRIQNYRQSYLESVSNGLSKKYQAKSASDIDSIKSFKQTSFGSNLSLTRSTNSLMNFPTDRGEYQKYILERRHSRQKSKRYKDLYDFYSNLEKMGKLERTTSSGELFVNQKNDEIIDYELWKQIRAKEKAKQELKDVYRKLRQAERENDFLFSTRDVSSQKWRGDSSLRCKERSVDNIREQFKKLEKEQSELEMSRQREIAAKKDTYKPLWRGSSVINVANSLTRRAAEKSDQLDKSSVQASLQRSLGGSNKFWSSLSLEQVTALKNQLNDIYGNDPVVPKKTLAPKRPDPPVTTYAKQVTRECIVSDSEQSSFAISEFEIVVPKKEASSGAEKDLGLHVRCHSMIASERSRQRDNSDVIKRSRSIGHVTSFERSHCGSVVQSPDMTEREKKRLSLTLGKEMLEKVGQTKTVTPRETRGALAAASAKCVPPKTSPVCSQVYKEKDDFLLVLTMADDAPDKKDRIEKRMTDWSVKVEKEGADQIDSTTESSDTSVKTVLHRSIELDDLQKKVEFYEKIEEQKATGGKDTTTTTTGPSKISSAQSFTDLKELFGESAAAKYRSIPLRSATGPAKAEQISCNDSGRGRSSSASPDVVASTRRAAKRDEQRPRSASPRASPQYYCSSSESLESLWQRCGSPDPEKYWRSYLKLVRDGTVRRLRAKFESLEDIPRLQQRRPRLARRFQSDPELARNLLGKVTDTKRNYIKPQEIPDVAWLRRKYELPARKRRGGVSPIPRVPWKLEDLTMPHINVISKTAELYDSVARSKPSPSLDLHREEARELETRRAVNRVREMFERSLSPESTKATSILGEMFTSAPDVHELRDVAPYLAGQWVAHRYPSRYDNPRSLSSPPDLSRSGSSKRSISPPSRKKAGSRSSSTSPVRPRTPVSILKQSAQQQQQQQQQRDVFADQPFDPSKHRPRFRYQPSPPPPIQPIKYVKPDYCCPKLAVHSARPSVVTFEGPRAKYTIAPPPPPPKAQHSSGERQGNFFRFFLPSHLHHYYS
uniref:SoHo domain-containing protein n=1 Tax=Trichogramma kaykai TaxID=54128 RepID=A0ABD2XA38_9HYME